MIWLARTKLKFRVGILLSSVLADIGAGHPEAAQMRTGKDSEKLLDLNSLMCGVRDSGD